MKFSITALFGLATVIICSALSAQEPPKAAGPEKEHQWLQQFVGDWVAESKGTAGPDQPEMESKGKMKTRSIGGMWVINEINAEMTGVTMTGVQIIGYDPARKKYVGTWIDSMTNYMWTYEGTVDATGKKITLEADGPNFITAGKTTKFRDEYEFKTADQIIATSSMLGEDGKWVTFMSGTMTRDKSRNK